VGNSGVHWEGCIGALVGGSFNCGGGLGVQLTGTGKKVVTEGGCFLCWEDSRKGQGGVFLEW